MKKCWSRPDFHTFLAVLVSFFVRIFGQKSGVIEGVILELGGDNLGNRVRVPLKIFGKDWQKSSKTTSSFQRKFGK